MRIIEGFESAKSLLTRRAPKGISGGDDREMVVRRIIEDVRTRGDAAVFEYTEKFDGVKLLSLEIEKSDLVKARKRLNDELHSALNLAAERIRDFHESQKDSMFHEINKAGLRQLIRPLKRVGVYVPGGTASYPSAMLMTVIPARVAGVEEVIAVTPPDRSGGISTTVMAAAEIAGVSRLFCIGGAQAIAAMAYGTETVPAFDKICGPGNIFVALAKKEVFGIVDIDGFQGPSDVLVIADENTDTEYCAAELLAQAEHDSLAEVVLATTSRKLADAVNDEVIKQLELLHRKSIAGESLEKGLIVVVAGLDEAIELSNLFAPEHLCFMIDNADAYLDKVTSAGCIVTGRGATIALGDYIAGPSHALPTNGTARFGSPLNIFDFIKFTSVIDTSKLDIKKLSKAASVIAIAEGLDAHAKALEKRINRSS